MNFESNLCDDFHIHTSGLYGVEVLVAGGRSFLNDSWDYKRQTEDTLAKMA